MASLKPAAFQNVPISVIVPAYNAAHTMSGCIRALVKQSIDLPYEIIVVDDGSEDSTGEVAQAAGASVLRIPRSRPAAARNAGISAASGDILCFTDADCEPAADWLAQITAPLREAGIDAAKGIYATRQRSLVARFVQLEYEDKYDLMARSTTIDFIDTYSAAYRASVLRVNGGFDTRFTYLEDQELSFRLAANDCVMKFQPTAVVYHTHVAGLLAYMKKKFTIGYWKVQVVRRFPERAMRDSHTPQVMKLQILLAGLVLLSVISFILASLLQWQTPSNGSALATVFLALLFLTTTAPFFIKAWSKDWPVAVVAPVLLFARSLGLGLGTLWGVVAPPASLREPD